MFDEEFAQLGAPICAIGAVGAEVQRRVVCRPPRLCLLADPFGLHLCQEPLRHVVGLDPADRGCDCMMKGGPSLRVHLSMGLEYSIRYRQDTMNPRFLLQYSIYNTIQ